MIPVLLLAAALAAPPAPAEGRLVEEIVAVVRNPPGAPPRVVTLTKLTEEARIALVSRGALEAATGPLDREALRVALDWLLDQMLLADEAGRLQIAVVGGDETAAEVRRFAARFESGARYASFLAGSDLTEDELAATLARMLRVQRYVVSRVGRSAAVLDDEVERWARSRGESEPSPATREAARAQLVEDRARGQVKELLAELRAKADVRILDSLRDEAGKEP